MRLDSRLNAHVEQQGLGDVFAAEMGFYLARRPDTVRAPDAASIAHGRLPKGPTPAGFIDPAPDLVVKVVSPDDTAAAMQAKVEDWLQASPRLD